MVGRSRVPVYWNAHHTGAFDADSGTGTEWQCVELAQRLFFESKWEPSRHFPNVNAARDIYLNASVAPAIQSVRHANGDGLPGPGDLIVEDRGPYSSVGHVDVVDYLDSGHAYVVDRTTV